MRQCIVCNKIVKGRSDKKYCSKECSNKFHINKQKAIKSDKVRSINSILLNNRRILQQLCENNQQSKIKVSRLTLSQLGFDFNYITGIYFNRQGKMYRYVYEFAWMEFSTQEVLIVKK